MTLNLVKNILSLAKKRNCYKQQNSIILFISHFMLLFFFFNFINHLMINFLFFTFC
ncbi:hypothetical protein BN1325_460004 [Staphylococcus aureus]|nr:hypothetical protein BN1323_410006 [Staphylococcus aureus]CRI25109.1 hypothetical protein BN1322_470006 [Staphylococcus aureus]CRI29632.1 hypothetical protein BN1325_460004 [Staphylococcus aureus]CRI31684.1 hypothetical protein BN1325_460004 [Staphylococcus aureus]